MDSCSVPGPVWVYDQFQAHDQFQDLYGIMNGSRTSIGTTMVPRPVPDRTFLESIPDSSSGISFQNRFRNWNRIRNRLRNWFRNRLQNWFRNRNRIWNRIRNRIWNRIRNRIWNRIRNRIWNRIRNRIRIRIRNQIRNRLRNRNPFRKLKLDLESELAPKLEASKRNQFRHRPKNRRLGPIILRIDNPKKSLLAKDPFLFPGDSRTDSASRTSCLSIQELIHILELILILESIMIPLSGRNCDYGADSDRGIVSSADSGIGSGINSGISSGSQLIINYLSTQFNRVQTLSSANIVRTKACNFGNSSVCLLTRTHLIQLLPL